MLLDVRISTWHTQICAMCFLCISSNTVHIVSINKTCQLFSISAYVIIICQLYHVISFNFVITKSISNVTVSLPSPWPYAYNLFLDCSSTIYFWQCHLVVVEHYSLVSDSNMKTALSCSCFEANAGHGCKCDATNERTGKISSYCSKTI